MRLRYAFVATLILVSLSRVSVGQTFDAAAVPVLRTAPTDGIRVDGILDDADWEKVEPATNFVAYRPNEGARPSQRTEARVLYGKNAIYVGATMFDTEPDRIRRILTRRDEGGGADSFTAAFDSYNDRKTA